MKTILITGASGYIGSVLTRELCQFYADAHVNIVAVDNLMYGQNTLVDLCYHENFYFHNVDVTDTDALIKTLEEHKPDVVIPLAALVGMPICNKFPEKTVWDINYGHVKVILDFKKFCLPSMEIIYPNTNSGYGIGMDGECAEESPLNPVSLYGVTKVAAEDEVLKAGGITLRLATVFGTSPRMRLDLLVNDFVYRAATDGFIVLYEAHFKRNYVHIQDVVSVMMELVQRLFYSGWPDSIRGPYNFGLDNANLSKKELCLLIKEQLPNFCIMESEIHKDPDQRNYVISNQKIADNLNIRAGITVSEGITELIKAYEIIKPNDNRFSNV